MSAKNTSLRTVIATAALLSLAPGAVFSKGLSRLHKDASLFFDQRSGQTIPVVDGEIIVQLAAGIDLRQARHLADELSVTISGRVDQEGRSFIVQMPSLGQLGQDLRRLGLRSRARGMQIRKILDALRADSRVRLAEPNALMDCDGGVTVDDEYFAEQEALAMLKMKQTWDYQKGESSAIVAVLDTGLAYLDGSRDGEQFAAALDFIDVDIFSPWDFVHDDAYPMDDNGHGSHVAGIIAASGDNGEGVAGMAWGVSLMPIKVLDEHGSGSLADLVAGIDWAIAHGAHVINMSISFSPGYFPGAILEEKLQEARAAGIVLVGSSGNDGVPAVSFPAAFNEVIAVGAANDQGGRASYSNYGPGLDVIAPGGTEAHPILSLGVDPYSSSHEPGYWYAIGTSSAAPHVSALAALLISRHDSTPDETESMILGTAGNLVREFAPDEVPYDDTVGFGLIDPKLAVRDGTSLDDDHRAYGQIPDYSAIPRYYPSELFGAIVDTDEGLLLLLEDDTGLFAFVDSGCDSRTLGWEAENDGIYETVCDVEQYRLDGYTLDQILGADGGVLGFLAGNGGLVSFLSGNGALLSSLANNGGLLGMISSNDDILVKLEDNGCILGLIDGNGALLSFFSGNGGLISFMQGNGAMLSAIMGNGGMVSMMAGNGALLGFFSSNGNLILMTDTEGVKANGLHSVDMSTTLGFEE